ncbi:hypothetical protein HK098_001807 [Nowakowskiella sp. JEL0407]|nr:hypothetical protein HK098_001807 [Nowakowskiella sp. JEL0407]
MMVDAESRNSVVEFLILKGVRVNVHNKKGKTALHVATRKGALLNVITILRLRVADGEKIDWDCEVSKVSTACPIDGACDSEIDSENVIEDNEESENEYVQDQLNSVVHSVAWNCDGKKVASGSFDQSARVWTLSQCTNNQTNRDSVELRGHQGDVDQLCWDPSNPDRLVTASVDKTVRLWDIRGTIQVLKYPELSLIHTISAHTAGCYCLEFDPRGRYFATGSADALVSLWDVDDFVCVRTFGALDWPVRAISFSFDGELIASASEDHVIDISHVDTGESVHKIPCDAAMNTVAWHPSKFLLAYAGDEIGKHPGARAEGNLRIFGFSK